MASQKDVEKLSYEQAFEELQTIVNLLDEGQQPLEDTLRIFERGQALALHCEKLLNQAQLKVQKISEKSDPDAGGKNVG